MHARPGPPVKSAALTEIKSPRPVPAPSFGQAPGGTIAAMADVPGGGRGCKAAHNLEIRFPGPFLTAAGEDLSDRGSNGGGGPPSCHLGCHLCRYLSSAAWQLRRHITGYHMSKLTDSALRILTELRDR